MPPKRGMENIPKIHTPPRKDSGSERMQLKLVDFEAEIVKLNCEALDSTRNIVNDLENINESGVQTLALLEEQDEAIDKIEDNLAKLQEDMTIVRRDIELMQKCCCCGGCSFWKLLRSCLCCCRQEVEEEKHAEESFIICTSEKASSSPPLVIKHSTRRKSTSQGDYMKRLTNDNLEDEMERNMKQVDETLDSIKHLAIDINVQLTIQEPKIDRIHTRIQNSDLDLDGANEKVKKMLE